MRVSPGMLETKVMVAPNSPSALAKHKTEPAQIPGSANGRETRKNVQKPFAPERSRRCLKTAVDAFKGQSDGPQHQRKAHHRTCQRSSRPTERKAHPEIIEKKRADGPFPAEGQQQNGYPVTTGGNTRGKCSRPSRNSLSGKAPSRQDVGKCCCERQDRQSGDHRNFQTEALSQSNRPL